MATDQLTVDGDPIRYDLIPAEHLRGGIQRYIQDGVKPGDFLCGVIANDLYRAAMQADPESLAALPAIVRWLYNYAPPECFGSVRAMNDWRLKRQALARRREADQHAAADRVDAAHTAHEMRRGER